MKQEKTKNFFQTLLDSIFGGNDAEAEKKRQLKLIAKKIAKSKYNKFYKFSGNEALPAIARYIYEIYKVIYPAQTMFQGIQNQNILKRLVIDFCTPKEIKDLEDSLSSEHILSISKKIPSEQLKEQALLRLSEFSDYFTLEKISEIDNLYKQIISVKDFCTFDFYFFLKKFNKSIREADFSSIPQFEKINAEYILDDLKDFISIAWAIPFDTDFSNMTKLLRSYKGVEPITLQNWKRVVLRLNNLKQSGIFEMIIKLISLNPTTTVELQTPNSNIIEPYLDKLKEETENVLEKLVEQEKSSKAAEICSQLFQNVDMNQLKNYTDELNETFKRKGICPFIHYQPLNYLKVFLIEIFKKDIREYYDLVFVRGHWESQALSAPFSEAYNSLIMTSDLITQFDAQLAEDSSVGMKIKTLLPKTERDNGAKNIINRLSEDSNDKAYKFIVESMQNLIVIGKIIKALIEDMSKPKSSLITNWKELSHFSEIPLREVSVKIYKKIYLFTTLIKTCLVTQETTDE